MAATVDVVVMVVAVLLLDMTIASG